MARKGQTHSIQVKLTNCENLVWPICSLLSSISAVILDYWPLLLDQWKLKEKQQTSLPLQHINLDMDRKYTCRYSLSVCQVLYNANREWTWDAELQKPRWKWHISLSEFVSEKQHTECSYQFHFQVRIHTRGEFEGWRQEAGLYRIHPEDVGYFAHHKRCPVKTSWKKMEIVYNNQSATVQ